MHLFCDWTTYDVIIVCILALNFAFINSLLGVKRYEYFKGNLIFVSVDDDVTVTLKSVQSALSDLLTTSATHGTFSRPSTKRGLILIGLELNTNARESFEHC